MFEYGSRCGFWRVLRAFESRQMPFTAFACSLALERSPDIARACRDSSLGVDVCCHGWRWEDHIAMSEAQERETIAKAAQSIVGTLGAPPTGWYCRTAPSTRTRKLLVEHGGFAYDSDAYNDDLPYWTKATPSTGSTRELGPGKYSVVAECVVGASRDLDSEDLCELDPGTVVDVVEVVTDDIAQRIRGRIVDPPGWISLMQTDGGELWA